VTPACAPSWPTCPPTPGQDGAGAIKIASNETVDGPLPVCDRDRRSHREHQTAIRTTGTSSEGPAGQTRQLRTEHIAVGAGSVSCASSSSRSPRPSATSEFGWRSFEIYPLQVRTAGCDPVQCRSPTTSTTSTRCGRRHRPDPADLVCNPNKPHQHVVDPEAWPVSSPRSRRTS